MSSHVLAEANITSDLRHNGPRLASLERDLDYQFNDTRLLVDALSHRSWCAEQGGSSNERLEFLGDAVLGLLVAEWVYRRYVDQPEGYLAKVRAVVVSSSGVAGVARNISLGDAILLGRGEETSGGSDKDSILSDAMEAVIGAIYIDGGHESASDVVGRLFEDVIDRAAVDPWEEDYKTRLQELVVSRMGVAPSYRLTTDGLDHEKIFHVIVEFGNEIYGPASGTSRKRAEQAAAKMACDFFGHLETGGAW